MVKLTAQMIADSPQYTNTLRDREVDLRGYKLSVIENLGATLDQFDCIDLSDNDIKKLENFPLLKRLKMLILNNNRVCRFEDRLEECLPQLETIVLTNNNVQELTDLEPLKSIKTLTNISFIRNPITTKPNYRYFVIHCLPQVRVLDFQRVKMKERAAAKKLFSGKKGELLKKDIAAKRSKTFEVKDIVKPSSEEDKEFIQEKYKDQEAIKTAIANATTLEEVRKLELLLQQGHIPGKSVEKNGGNENNGDTNVEEMDEEEDEEEKIVTNGKPVGETNGATIEETNGNHTVETSEEMDEEMEEETEEETNGETNGGTHEESEDANNEIIKEGNEEMNEEMNEDDNENTVVAANEDDTTEDANEETNIEISTEMDEENDEMDVGADAEEAVVVPEEKSSEELSNERLMMIKKLKVPELKAELSRRGLQVKGRKDELVVRLLSAMEEEGDEEEEEEEAEEEVNDEEEEEEE